MRQAVVLVSAALAASGCATGFGPRALQNERPHYNQRIVRSTDEELLLNIVRFRYNDTPLFLELGAIVAQYTYDAHLNATGNVTGTGTGDATVGTGLGYSESPTITYTPLKGEDYATRMLAPLPLNSLMFFSQSGWSAERLLLLAVQRMNDVQNAPTASGPTPEIEPDWVPFRDLATRMHRLQLAGLVGLNWEEQVTEKDPPGRNPRFWIRSPSDPRSPLADDVAAVRRHLGLLPGREEFTLTAFPLGRKRDEVAIRCRSLLGMLYFLSAAVEAPPDHVAAGLVTVTRDAAGQPFDWSRALGGVMAVHAAPKRPPDAYVAVRHRGYWFWVADADQASKKTFSLLNVLLSLQSATAKAGAPILTLPVGQ